MKVLLISPGWPKGRLWGELGFRFPSLSLAAIAAVTPPGWEVVWSGLLADFSQGRLQRLYKPESMISMADIPVARRDIFKGKGYLLSNTIQTTRGCPFDCDILHCHRFLWAQSFMAYAQAFSDNGIGILGSFVLGFGPMNICFRAAIRRKRSGA